MELAVSREDRRLMRRRGAGAREMKERQFGFTFDSLPDSLTELGYTTVELTDPVVTIEERTAPKIASPKDKSTVKKGSRKKTAVEEKPDGGPYHERSEKVAVARKRSRTVRSKDETLTYETTHSAAEKELLNLGKEPTLNTAATSVLIMTNVAKPKARHGSTGVESTLKRKSIQQSRPTIKENELRPKLAVVTSDEENTTVEKSVTRKPRGRPRKRARIGDMCLEQATDLEKVKGPMREDQSVPNQAALGEKPGKSLNSNVQAHQELQKPFDNHGLSRETKSKLGTSKASTENQGKASRSKKDTDPGFSFTKRSTLATKGKASIQIHDEFATTTRPEVEDCVGEPHMNRPGRSYDSSLTETSSNIIDIKKSGRNQRTQKKASPVLGMMPTKQERIPDSQVQQAIPRRQPPENKRAETKSLIRNEKVVNRSNTGQSATRRPKMTLIEDESDSSELEDYGEVKVPTTLKLSGALLGKWRL